MSFFQHNDKYSPKFDYNGRGIGGVLAIRTRDRRMIDTDEYTELWRPCFYKISLYLHIHHKFTRVNNLPLSLSLSLSLSISLFLYFFHFLLILSSETRIGNFSPLWQNFKCFLQFLAGLFTVRQKFQPTLACLLLKGKLSQL